MNCASEPSNLSKFTDELRHAWREYLALPTMIIGAFVALGFTMAYLEQSGWSWVERLRALLQVVVFTDVDATRDILISSAATLITITSITFTVLLVAVQQAASSMSTQIIDQFLRRPINKFVFGYFVGMSLYSLITLALIRPQFNPVLATVLAFAFAGFALYLLASLVYITLTQMRPSVVVQAIHDDTLLARARQAPLLARTQRSPTVHGDRPAKSFRSRGDGYVAAIDLDRIAAALGDAPGAELVLGVRIGSFVAHGDVVASVVDAPASAEAPLADAVLRGVRLTRARDLDEDAAHGVEQIMNIGWTTISSAQHSPSAGIQAVNALRDLLAEWSFARDDESPRDRLPIVYDDDVPTLPLRAIESLAVAAVESHQHQSFGHVLRAIAMMVGRLPGPLREQAISAIGRLIGSLQALMLTTELDQRMTEVAAMLEAAGEGDLAGRVRRALEQARRKAGG